jgi:hypothetical protein
MPQSAIPSPKTGRELIDEYFIETRHRVIEIAAYLDRLDRARDASTETDFRSRALREALAVLCEGSYPRADRIQMIFSDPTTEPRAELDQKAAKGAFDPGEEKR